MINIRRIAIVAAFAAVLAASLSVHAQEKKIRRADLPPAVQKTVDDLSKGAVLKGFSTEIEDGKKIYEVEMTVNGRGKDISMDPQGKVLEIEEEVPIDSLSAAVKEGLTKAAGKGKITKVESLTKEGKLVAAISLIVKG